MAHDKRGQARRLRLGETTTPKQAARAATPHPCVARAAPAATRLHPHPGLAFDGLARAAALGVLFDSLDRVAAQGLKSGASASLAIRLLRSSICCANRRRVMQGRPGWCGRPVAVAVEARPRRGPTADCSGPAVGESGRERRAVLGQKDVFAVRVVPAQVAQHPQFVALDMVGARRCRLSAGERAGCRP